MAAPLIDRALAVFLPAFDEVVVVRRSLAVDDTTVARFHATLDELERARVARYVFPHLRRDATVSRGSLRELLASLLGDRAASLRFVVGPQGKPALADRALEFNVSHSGTWLYIAIAQKRELGVDVEGGNRTPDVDRLAPTVFTPGERAELHACDVAARPHAFLRGWTRKEAYVKVIGTGLSMPLADFSVSLGGDAAVQLVTHALPHAALAHAIHDLPAPPGHAAALAWHRGAVAVRRVVLVDASA